MPVKQLLPQFDECGKPGVPDGSECINLTRYIMVRIPLGVDEVLTDWKEIIDMGPEFYWRGVMARNQDAFRVRFNVNDRYYLSNARIPLVCGFNTGMRGRAWTPEFCIPAGGHVGIEIENLLGEATTARFSLVGVLRRMVAAS